MAVDAKTKAFIIPIHATAIYEDRPFIARK
jgi:hypothetical protein